MTQLEAAVGRYLQLDVLGTRYRVYFEESGQGVPLLLQHTAGSEGTQWRHLLEDPWMRARFRMVAYDLPFHGKSLPPRDERWWESEYRLTLDFLRAFILGFSDALELREPIFMGCSMGGHVAADLALHHPDAFRAVIGLEAAMYTGGGDLSLWHHPRIGGDAAASLMHGLTAPGSPEWARRETGWGYARGAPGVFKGDLRYYAEEHDLRDRAHEIDTSRIEVWIMSGEYDWSATPEMSRELASRIPGAHFVEMKGLGHFPMCEDPERFRDYLQPVLEKLLEAPR